MEFPARSFTVVNNPCSACLYTTILVLTLSSHIRVIIRSALRKGSLRGGLSAVACASSIQGISFFGASVRGNPKNLAEEGEGEAVVPLILRASIG